MLALASWGSPWLVGGVCHAGDDPRGVGRGDAGAVLQGFPPHGGSFLISPSCAMYTTQVMAPEEFREAMQALAGKEAHLLVLSERLAALEDQLLLGLGATTGRSGSSSSSEVGRGRCVCGACMHS